MLDTASPPAPAAWVADLRALGASAGVVYTWGGAGAGKYTAAHVAEAKAAARQLLACCVPGSAPPSLATLLASARALGLEGGPYAFDVARGDNAFTAWAWLQQAIAGLPSEWSGGPYAQPTLRPSCPWGWWWACGSAGAAIPAGAIASQYTQVTGPSGTVYDQSVVNLSLWQQEAPTMFVAQQSDPPAGQAGGAQSWLIRETDALYISSEADLANLTAKLGNSVPLSTALIEAAKGSAATVTVPTLTLSGSLTPAAAG
jgi:hypothetical protein